MSSQTIYLPILLKLMNEKLQEIFKDDVKLFQRLIGGINIKDFYELLARDTNIELLMKGVSVNSIRNLLYHFGLNFKKLTTGKNNSNITVLDGGEMEPIEYIRELFKTTNLTHQNTYVFEMILDQFNITPKIGTDGIPYLTKDKIVCFHFEDLFYRIEKRKMYKQLSKEILHPSHLNHRQIKSDGSIMKFSMDYDGLCKVIDCVKVNKNLGKLFMKDRKWVIEQLKPHYKNRMTEIKRQPIWVLTQQVIIYNPIIVFLL